MPLLNPKLWGSQVAPADGEPSPYARSLEEENAVLREQIAQRLDLTGDMQRLAEALGARGRGALDRLPRVVVARVLRTADPSDYRRSILIDRGAEDRITRGLAVASGEVFIGTVEVVHGRSALVRLVTDRFSRLEVAVRTEANQRLTGFVRGNGRAATEGTLDVRFVHVPDEAGRILAGAPVYTSNADPMVPPALLVGTVTSVTDKDLDGLPQIGFKPALNLGRSTHVFVLLPP